MAIQIHDVRRRYGDARPVVVIGALAVGDDHVEAIDGAALKEAHQNRASGRAAGPGGGRKCRARQEQRIEAQAHERQAAGFDENTSRDGHCFWKSGPPSASPTAIARACMGSLMSTICSRMTSRVCADIVPPSSC